MDDPKTQAREAARLIRQGLTQLGCCYQTRDGGLVEVSFASVQFVEDTYALVEVDTRRLPPRVTIPKLVHLDTLHHLTAVVGKPVKRLNTTGLTYCVALKPQKKRRLPKMVELDLAHRPRGDYVIGFGLSQEGEVWKPLEKLRHIVVAGSTDSGKSAFLRSLLYQFCKSSAVLSPALSTVEGPSKGEPVELYLTDMEGLTFAAFEGVPQLAMPIAESVEEATRIAFQLTQEMERRAVLYQATGRFPEKLSEYNAQFPISNTQFPNLDTRLPWVVAVFDEFTALMDEAGKGSDLYRLIGQLAMRGRKYGITLVFAGQDFKADLLNTRITNQLRTRVQFGCATTYQSQVVLGRAGAEKITTPGRALISFGGKIVEVQTFWVDKERVLGLRRGPVSPLAGDERELVRYALEHLGGKFNIHDLATAFRGRVSQRKIEQLSRAWEARGWLMAGPTRADGKRITAELASLVGREQKSEDSDGA